jgi:hypothetical protein
LMPLNPSFLHPPRSFNHSLHDGCPSAPSIQAVFTQFLLSKSNSTPTHRPPGHFHPPTQLPPGLILVYDTLRWTTLKPLWRQPTTGGWKFLTRKAPAMSR